MEIRLRIPGKPITKKNSQTIVYTGQKCPVCKKGQRAIPIQSKQYKNYEKAALDFLRMSNSEFSVTIDEPVQVSVQYYVRKNKDGSIPRVKPDLTNLLEATDDILVRAKILSDDNVDVIQSHDGSRFFWIDPDQEEGVNILIKSIEW